MKKEYDNPAAPGLYECAHLNDVKMMSYEDFIEQFRSMTTEELDKFDLDYSYTHHKQIFLSNIYILWKNNNFWEAKRCSLVDKCIIQNTNIRDELLNDILCFCPLSPKQISLVNENILLAIPDAKINKEIIKQSVSLYGYNVGEEIIETNKNEIYDTNWVILTIYQDFDL